jgi:aminoglycoside phosphotransferase (APT) family kinase protein
VDDDFDVGWDNRVTLVDGRWVHRTPRFPDREAQLRRESALLPWLGSRLPLPVPLLEIVAEDPFTVRHAYLPGGPCPGSSAAQGEAVGAFLRALHAIDPDAAVSHGALEADAAHADLVATVHRMSRMVLPLLPGRFTRAATALLERVTAPPVQPCLSHGDLGPDHILVLGEQVTGIIDWGDCAVRDPAIDLAWTVFGAGARFADAVVTAYGADDATRSRGLDFHLLGPWHEVLYGLDTAQGEFVTSGLTGVVTRLDR